MCLEMSVKSDVPLTYVQGEVSPERSEHPYGPKCGILCPCLKKLIWKGAGDASEGQEAVARGCSPSYEFNNLVFCKHCERSKTEDRHLLCSHTGVASLVGPNCTLARLSCPWLAAVPPGSAQLGLSTIPCALAQLLGGSVL